MSKNTCQWGRDCTDNFSIEPHGDGQVLYYGRCNCKHGYNLCRVDDVSYNALEILNAPLARVEELEKAIAEWVLASSCEYAWMHGHPSYECRQVAEEKLITLHGESDADKTG